MIKRIEKFGAEWCRPCRDLETTLESILSEYPDIKFVCYDADTEEDEIRFVEKHITNVPQVFMYDESDTEVSHFRGVLPESEIRKIIDNCNNL